MQKMPDPSIDFQRKLQQVWTTLEQSLASTTKGPSTFSQQTQACSTRGQGREAGRGLGDLFYSHTLGSHYPQFEDQYGDHYSPFTQCSRDSQDSRGRSCTTARTSATSSTISGSDEAFGATPWFEAEHGLSARRTGAEVTRSGSGKWGVRSQAQPWSPQQDGEGREASFRPIGQDPQARSGLADFREPSGREVSQAQGDVLGNPSTVGFGAKAEDRRACSHQGGDHSGFTISSEHGQSRRSGSVGCRGSGLDGITSTSGSSLGLHGRVSGYGDGRRGSNRSPIGGPPNYRPIPQGRFRDISFQSGQRAPEAKDREAHQDRRQNRLDEENTGLGISVDCVVYDVFAGDWTWAPDVPPQLGIETCGIVSRVGGGEELLGAEQCAHALRHQALGGVDDGTFGTEAAHGECVAAMVPPSSPRQRQGRHVRFNPIIEIVEFETDFDFILLAFKQGRRDKRTTC